MRHWANRCQRGREGRAGQRGRKRKKRNGGFVCLFFMHRVPLIRNAFFPRCLLLWQHLHRVSFVYRYSTEGVMEDRRGEGGEREERKGRWGENNSKQQQTGSWTEVQRSRDERRHSDDLTHLCDVTSSEKCVLRCADFLQLAVMSNVMFHKAYISDTHEYACFTHCWERPELFFFLVQLLYHCTVQFYLFVFLWKYVRNLTGKLDMNQRLFWQWSWFSLSLLTKIELGLSL